MAESGNLFCRRDGGSYNKPGSYIWRNLEPNEWSLVERFADFFRELF